MGTSSFLLFDHFFTSTSVPFTPGAPIVDHLGQGLRYDPKIIAAVKEKAPLKHETFLQDCADAFIMLAKNTSMTGMKVQVDAGLNIHGN
jgi:enoyl-[acyl-carrier-protein] reductase (NADH)